MLPYTHVFWYGIKLFNPECLKKKRSFFYMKSIIYFIIHKIFKEIRKPANVL